MRRASCNLHDMAFESPAPEVEPSDTPRLISIVIPVFRNAASLRQLYSELIDVAQDRFPTCGLEIVFVDDGSDDDSWDVICSLREADPNRVSAHRLSRNFGQLSAMVAGYRLARGDALVSISADLQDPTELIGDMVNRWIAGDDVVIANRAGRSDGTLSATTSRIAYWYARRSTPGIPEGGFDYFLMSRRAIDLLLQFKGRFRFLQGDLLWLGLPTSFIPYVRRERPHGKSGYSLVKRLSNFTDLVIDSSYGPIKAMSRLGFFVALLGFVYLVTIVIDWLAGGTPFRGWAPIMVTLLVLLGFIMIMLGIIGEYLWRIHDQVRERPMHVILTSEFAQVDSRDAVDPQQGF
jgi:polyisoprenyl-phosphate glycosyltransferase